MTSTHASHSTAGPEHAASAEGLEVFDVAIVGLGPVGSALAILLGQCGRRVVVLERWLEPYPLPRAVHFDHEIGRILQACGLGEELAAISEPAEIYEWRNAAGDTLLRFGRAGFSASGWPESSMFNQPALEALLAARVDALPTVEVRRGVELVGLIAPVDAPAESEGGPDGAVAPVLLSCREADVARAATTAPSVPATGANTQMIANQMIAMQAIANQTIAARYVVGCDGANSTVRSLIDAPLRDLGFFYDWLIVDVILDHPRVFDPINLQVCDPVRPTTAVSGGPGRRRWEFMRLPHESMEELNDEATAWRLLEPWDITPANARLERHTVYTFQARWAERWRMGRVFLAGDAAHLMPPFAGQGMCSGLRDAANLAWKLDLVLDGRADDALLDTYETERMPNASAVIGFSMQLGKVICVPDADEAAARDDAMRAGVVEGEVTEVPPLPAIDDGLLHGSPAAGSLFLQGRVTTDAGADAPVRADQVVGAGWTLLVAADGRAADLGLDPEVLAWFRTIGGRVHTIGSELADLRDADGAYEHWFTRHATVAVIQRPDFHVYGTVPETTKGDLPSAIDALVRQLRDDIHPRPTTLRRTEVLMAAQPLRDQPRRDQPLRDRPVPDRPRRDLTTDEVQAFVDDGVVCARQIMPASWLELVAGAVERNIAEPTAIGQFISIPEKGFLNDIFMWLADDDYRRFVLESPAAEIAHQALAGLGATGVTFFYDQSFVKEPGTQVPTPWHHDLTFWPVEGNQVCSIWMPLDPVTRETSGLEYIRGSHRWPQRFKAITPDYNDFMLNPDLDDVPDIDAHRDDYDLVNWDMEPGDVLIFHPLVVHGSGGNASTTTRRRALATRWFGDDVVYRDLPHTTPMPPGHELVDGEAFRGEMFPRLIEASTSA